MANAQEEKRPTVLVTAGSKHGSTTDIARRIARELEAGGLAVVESAPADVVDPGRFDAIVLGSAVYAGHWTSDAMDLARKLGEQSPPIPTWLFSSGPVGAPPKPEEDPVDASEATELTRARDHHVFAGKLDRSKLNFAEKAIMVALRAPEGDFRDWDAIDMWARGIADALKLQESKR